MACYNQIVQILGEVLSLADSEEALSPDTVLLGGLPEFDSMAVLSVITAIEENFGLQIDDDELDGEAFTTVSSLVEFVEQLKAA
ncbi:MAG: phosphopantetheine-binding protein [Pseudomonadota bacterium]